jgi:hypothetical protein
MPSKGEGDSGSGELGMSMADRRRIGDTDGDSSLSTATPASLPLSTLACLLIGALSGGPKLGGRASGLEGRPEAWLFI